MPYSSLRDFMDRLERSGRLVRVKAPVSPALEMTEIHTRLLAQQGPAVLFENVVKPDGSRYEMPVLINLFGTVERVAWGMDRTNCAASARRWRSCASRSRRAASARLWR
jgi:4-hydroxy-3-polyprenylbenzoate decarboxylase